MQKYVSVDVSEFQRPVDDSYEHKWFSFRVCDGDYRDRNAAHNLAWAIRARKAGRLDGFTVYVVYRPGENDAILANLAALKVPTDCVVMVDVESWAGQIRGNHSTEINALVSRLADRQGSLTRVWGYGNRGDLTAVWPKRPAGLMVVVASYGGTKPAMDDMAGWQYTDGQYVVTGLPSSSKPFGRCDHNVFYIPDQPAKPEATEDDMPLSDDDIMKIREAVWDKPHKSGTVTHTMEQWTVLGAKNALKAAIVSALPAGGDLTPAQLSDAVEKGVNAFFAGAVKP